MSDNNSSTLEAYADSAIGAGQSLIGKVTGSAGDQVFPLLPTPNPNPNPDTCPCSIPLATSPGPLAIAPSIKLSLTSPRRPTPKPRNPAPKPKRRNRIRSANSAPSPSHPAAVSTPMTRTVLRDPGTRLWDLGGRCLAMRLGRRG